MYASVRGFAAGVVFASLAACADPATAPKQSAPRAMSAAAPKFDFTATGNTLGIGQTDFVVSAEGGSFSIGGLYTVTFPANAVCDPSRSTYGPTEWDNDCTTLDSGQEITIHATLSLSSTGLAVDFSPALRFSPSAKVIISTDIFASVIKNNRDYLSKNPNALNPLAILYSSSFDGTAVRDFAKDKSVLTHVDLSTGTIWRRVKHFSGYSVVTGDSCEPSPDNPDCIAVDDNRTPPP
jgi:hypothetical protein